MSTLDGVIQDVGVCGPFQILLVLATQSTIVVSVWGMMLMAFGSYDPGWICLDDLDQFLNLSASAGLSNKTLNPHTPVISINSVPENGTDRCHLYNSCRNVSFMRGASTVVSEWGLVCDHKWTPSIIFTVQMVGVFAGSYITGHLGDCVGRRAALYGMVGLHGVANLLAAFSPSWQVFAAFRFLIGMATGGILTTGFVVPLEFTDQFWRGIVGSFPTWNFGAAFFSVAVILLKDWRKLHYVSAALSGLVLLPVIWVPESLRWLAAHGRDVKAGDVATKIARMNRRPVPSLEVLTEMAECERRRAIVQNSERYTYIDLFRDAASRKASVVMGFTWVTMAFVYYGISFGVQALSGDFYINFLILSVMEVPGVVFVVPVMIFLSRRWGTFVLLFGVSLACFGISLTLILGENNEGQQGGEESEIQAKIVMAVTVLAKIGTTGAWMVVTVFCGEVFPTTVRNLGFGYLNALARVGAILGPVLFPQDPGLIYATMAGMGLATLVCAGLMLTLPETKGAPLEDMLRSKAFLKIPQDDKIFMDGDINDGNKSNDVVLTEISGFNGEDRKDEL